MIELICGSEACLTVKTAKFEATSAATSNKSRGKTMMMLTRRLDSTMSSQWWLFFFVDEFAAEAALLKVVGAAHTAMNMANTLTV